MADLENKINLSEKQRENLIIEMAKLEEMFKKEEQTECIYFAMYHGLEGVQGDVLEMTIVQQYTTEEDEKREIDLNEKYKKLEFVKKCGMKIFIDLDYAIKYRVAPNIIKLSNLHNSSILYDKDGYYGKLKRKTKKIYEYSNLASTNPSLSVDDIRKYKMICEG